MRSEDRSQLDLLLPRSKPEREEITPELVRAVRLKARTLSEAWKYAQDRAGLDDKECYDILEMDSSHWSKIRKGLAWPPADRRWNQYMDVVGNEIPLIYAVESRGYDALSLRKHQDDKDRRIAELEQELAEEKKFSRRLSEAYRGGG